MAFVSKADRHFKSTNNVVGPGYYYSDKYNQSGQVPAPFNSSAKRYNQKTEILPGPGQYDVVKQIVQQGHVIATEDNLKIVDPPRPLTVFKSRSKRFQTRDAQTPGPGQYQLDQEMQKKIVKRQKSKIIEFLTKHNQSNPSIPFTIQVNSKVQIPQQTQIKPQQMNQSKSTKLSAFFSSQVQRTYLERPMTTLGPGSYNLVTQNPQKNSRPVTNSKRNRVKNISIAKCKVDKNQKTLIDQQRQLFKSNNLGPGYYYNQQTFSSFKKQTQPQCQFFGSTVDRFPATKQKNLAPNHYFTRPSTGKVQTHTRGNSNFISKKQRFVINQCSSPIVSPFTYQPKTDFENLLKKNMKKGKGGNFGSGAERFKQRHSFTPGPGSYVTDFKPESRVCLAVFNSKDQRINVRIKQNVPPPGAYELNKHTISNNVEKRKNDDHHHSPPFMSCEKRFKFQKITYESQEQQNQSIKNCTKMNLQKDSTRKKKIPFCSSQSRFKHQQALNSPVTYIDPSTSTFEKKSFNILFNKI